MRKKPSGILSLIVLLLSAPHLAKATCHAVSPAGSGSKSGANWSNACAGFTGNCANLTRGDTYYLADGNYSDMGSFAAPSGSTVTTVKKASDTGVRDADYGQNCSPSIAAGWNGATMGSRTGQARFVVATGGAGTWDLRGVSYVTFDGGNGYSKVGCGPYPCGLFIDSSSCASGSCYGVELQPSGSNGASHIIFKYLEMRGTSQTGTQNDSFFYAQGCCGGSVASNILISHTYERENAAAMLQMRDINGYTAEYNVFYRQALTSQFHGEVLSEAGSSNIVFRYNVFAQDGGTGVLVVLSDNPNYTYTTTNMDVYGNVFMDYSNSNDGTYGPTTDATIACINTRVVCNNLHIYNNDFVNMNNEGIASTPVVGWTMTDATGTGWVCVNNVFYAIRTSGGPNPWSVRNDCAGGSTDYNTALFSGTPSNFAHAHDVVDPANVNPYVNAFPSPLQWGDWHKATENAKWSNGTAVPSSLPYGTPPYTGCTQNVNCPDTDPDGVPRGGSNGWSRGAFQFGSGSSRPDPPSSLTVIVR